MQPLHAGFAGDAGGNGISVSWAYGYSNNLHSLWDSGLIARRVQLNFSNSYPEWDAHLIDLMQTTYKDDVAVWLTCDTNATALHSVDEFIPCSSQWVAESAALCCQTVYVDEAGQNMTKGTRYNLSDAYYERNIDLVERRIIQAGVRMAHILNSVAAAVIPSPSSSSAQPSLSSSSSSGGAATNSSTGADEPEKSEFSALDVVVVVIIVLLLLSACMFGYLFWRKRKYGLNSLFESVGEGRAIAGDGRRSLLDEDDSSTPYTRA